MSKTISILGCGWLGKPLAEKLITENHIIKGSVRSEEEFETLKKLGIEPYKLDVQPESLNVNDPSFFNCDILIISIPPGRKEGNAHLFADKVRVIRSTIDTNAIKQVIFISSTSVYPENKKMAKEEDAIEPNKPSGKALLQAEEVLKKGRTYDLTIIRFAGLIGLDRNPLNFYKKETKCRNANAPLNLIHIDDAVGVMDSVIQSNLWNHTFNACSDEHPTRFEFYALAAELNQMETPVFNTKAEARYKLVNSNKFVTLSGYKFKYRNPLDYVRDTYQTTKKS